MTAEEYRRALLDMVQKPPRAETIDSVQAVRQFKELAKKAQRTGGKSVEYLQNIYNQLRTYY